MIPGRRLRHALLSVLILVIGASGAVWLAAGEGRTDGKFTVRRDIPYVANAGPDQTLDLFLPDGASTRTGTGQAQPVAPLVVWIHGGGWRGGDKQSVEVDYLLSAGYAVASLNYRLSGDAIFPAQIQDVNAALGFLRDHAAEYHLDPGGFVVGGDSAGAHLAALAAFSANAQPDTFMTDPDVRIVAIVNFFGPMDLTVAATLQNEPEDLVDLLGGTARAKPELARAASPVSWIDAADPPVLTIHGDGDQVVPLSQSQVLDAALVDAGVVHTLMVIPDAPHGGPAFETGEIRGAVIAFLSGALKD
ncbi:MAG: Putative lipase/esterase [uncultured Thermomicrobiales bacterium]|uniref:Lipase/esterase n=1 Tax=uncultured Thermomicrobiales bacterium TaxID=1645740 RepID=A0A6J4V1Z7_9BACT|nr:MAG: Putative lipase/esterase [uncultured Thermomicrobiales bacterium]